MNYRILKILKLIRKDLNESIHRVNPFYVAGIHTAILTILLYIVTTYTFLISGRYQDLEAEVYEKAEQINKIRFLSTWYLPNEKTYSLKNNGSNHKSVLYCQDLVRIIFFEKTIRLGGKSPYFFTLTSGNPLPRHPLERAKLVLSLINIIGHSHPFPKGSLKPIQKFGWTERRSETVVFKSLSDVREWLKELQEINEELLSLTYMPSTIEPEDIKKVFDPIVEENRILIEKGQILPRSIWGERDPFIILENFRENLKKSEAIAESVKMSLRKLENFKVNIPPGGILEVGFAGIFVVFIIAVIWPMLTNRVNKLAQIWVPSIFYLSAYGYIIYFTIKKIQKI